MRSGGHNAVEVRSAAQLGRTSGRSHARTPGPRYASGSKGARESSVRFGCRSVHRTACGGELLETNELQRQLEFLVGASCSPPNGTYFDQVASEIDSLDGITFDQLTRLLIAAGEDRVSEGFFEFFSALGNSFSDRVNAWRRLSMRHYGNFRFAFKRHRRDDIAALEAALVWSATDLAGRPDFGGGLRRIDLRDTPQLGYIAGGPALALKGKQAAGESLGPEEEDFLQRFENAREAGLHNTYEYACTAYLDVYVATSMRATEESTRSTGSSTPCSH